MIAGRTTSRTARFALLAMLLSCSDLRAQERLPPLAPDQMTPQQKKVAADFMAIRKNSPTGPFAVMLRVPELMDLAFKWRLYLTTKPVLDQRLIELGILVTARHWTQQYEWNAHHPTAVKAGLKPETIAAIAEGRRPSQMPDDEAALYDLLIELLHNHGVSDATYARALAKLGEAGIVEATSVSGYYAMLAMVMNTARTPLQGGARPPLAAFP
jgi:4-carboxymuconolactone decarboxylase